jgi:hypothetical protein
MAVSGIEAQRPISTEITHGTLVIKSARGEVPLSFTESRLRQERVKQYHNWRMSQPVKGK